MGDQTQAYDIFQTPLSSGYPLPLMLRTSLDSYSFSLVTLKVQKREIFRTFLFLTGRFRSKGKILQNSASTVYTRSQLFGKSTVNLFFVGLIWAYYDVSCWVVFRNEVFFCKASARVVMAIFYPSDEFYLCTTIFEEIHTLTVTINHL